MPIWLTSEEQQAWRGLIHLTEQPPTALGRQLQDEHAVSLADYEVLGRLHDATGQRLRARDLGASLGWEQSRPVPPAHPDATPGHVDAVRTLVFDALSPQQVTQLADLTGHLMDHLADTRHGGGTVTTDARRRAAQP